jgi:predicted nuclease with TOPRIM domain|tara:strand:- start:38 stop:532 length:495 start_codon:yes stop_codon:yes gene_type:complete
MENNDQYRNMTLSLKVTASQKAGYVKIASSLNLTLSEWLSSIIEMNKNSYEKFGEPTKNETKLKDEIGQLKNDIQNLKNKLIIAEELKAIELKSNLELRQVVVERTYYGRAMKQKKEAIDAALISLNSSYKKVCKNIDDFAEKQDDGFFLFSSFKVDEIKSLKE